MQHFVLERSRHLMRMIPMKFFDRGYRFPWPAVLLVFGLAAPGWTQQPPPNGADGGNPPAASANASDSSDERPVEYWVSQLNSDQFLRREKATRRLVQAGSEAVPAVVAVLGSGELEVTERAISVLRDIAVNQRPSETGGAWAKLQELSESGVGSQASRASLAVEEIRKQRDQQARRQLAAAGVFIGAADFVVRARSRLVEVVQLEGEWENDLKTLEWLRWVDGIQFARVKGQAVQPEVLRQLIRMPKLHTLSLVDGHLEAETLQALMMMGRIRTLELRYTTVEDELIGRLADLPVRGSLSLMGTGVPEETVEQMRQEQPGVHIEHKQGGFLGVTCTAGFNICQINSVLSGSAAERAGLQTGDVIIGLDDVEVKQFSDLQEAINQHVPGDEVEVKFTRAGTTQSAKVRLGKLNE